MGSGLAEDNTAASGDLRARIVRASVELLEEQGLAGLSMREVARRAGVSHQAPYHHFEDREAILGAVAEEGFRMLSAHLTEHTSKAPAAAHLRIAAAGRAYVRFACTYPAYFRVMFRPELVNLERCPGAEAEGDRAFALLQDAVAAAIAEGVPAKPSVEALVVLCWSVAHGLACLVLDGPLARKMPNAERDTLIDDTTEAFSHLLATRAKTIKTPAKRAGTVVRARRKR